MKVERDAPALDELHNGCPPVVVGEGVEQKCGAELLMRAKVTFTFTFTFSHLAHAFIQSDVQGREQSSYEQ